jgi:hypothetical protein
MRKTDIVGRSRHPAEGEPAGERDGEYEHQRRGGAR